jgi:hypothetical protein
MEMKVVVGFENEKVKLGKESLRKVVYCLPSNKSCGHLENLSFKDREDQRESYTN